MQGLKVFGRELASDLTHTFGRWVLFIEVGLGILFIGFLFVVGNLVYPYRAVVIYEYKTVPIEVCPGRDVGVEIEWEIRDDLQALEITYEWSAVNDPTTIFGGAARFEDIKPRPRMEQESPLIRLAPFEPGLWKLRTSYGIFGTRLGLPVRQDLDNVTSEVLVRVLEYNDKKCEGSL